MGGQPWFVTSLEKVYKFYTRPPWAVEPSEKHLVLGGQGQLWTEFIPDLEHLEYMAFPRALALAERLWTPNNATRGFKDFLIRLESCFRELERRQVRFRRPGFFT